MAPDDSDHERDVADAVRAVRAGDAEAFAVIVKRFQGPLMTLCRALLRDRQAAEELAQDALVQAFERLDLYDMRRPMKPWLYRIAYRLALERWRAESRETARREVVESMRGGGRAEPEPPERVLAGERSEILWQAVSELPMGERTAVVLYYREGLTVDEVARTMGISPGTVKTHLFRARSQIQASLRSRNFDEGDIR